MHTSLSKYILFSASSSRVKLCVSSSIVDCSRFISGRFWDDGSEDEPSNVVVREVRKDVVALGRRAGFREEAYAVSTVALRR